jgi:hypothetical protein
VNYYILKKKPASWGWLVGWLLGWLLGQSISQSVTQSASQLRHIDISILLKMIIITSSRVCYEADGNVRNFEMNKYYEAAGVAQSV